ncbi:MAG: Gfo/Idh/MocA family oxidoreductase [Actinobacteria bacterium]|nr:Gfo/Idh/MocA family oxidoreductase [Actinomycetota bacterium]
MSQLRVAVVGTGSMGTDHIIRINTRISGASITAIIEPDQKRAKDALVHAPEAKKFENIEQALASGLVDAVLIATPGEYHEAVIMPIIAAEIPVLCEKPMTPDVPSALRICAAEVKAGKKIIQVGFMRRFDEGYIELREQIASQRLGELLALHCTHRNPSVPDWYGNDMLIADSVSHEFDIVRYLTNSPIVSVEVKQLKRNKLAPDRLNEPILVLMETESGIVAAVEMNVSVQFGYQVITEAVFQKGVAEIGRSSGMTTWEAGRSSQSEHTTYITRFARAYDDEIQAWVNAAAKGGIGGPTAWDGYMSVAGVQAGLASLRSGNKEFATYEIKPTFYN